MGAIEFNLNEFGESPRFVQVQSYASFRSCREVWKPTTIKDKIIHNLTLDDLLEEDGSRPVFTDLDKYD